MSVKKVLLAYDASEGGRRALQWAADFAGQISAETVIATVFAPYEHDLMQSDGNGTVCIDEECRQSVDKLQDAAQSFFRSRNLAVDAVILEGDPSHELLGYAEKIQADMIICGTRGLGGFKSLLLGSVAHKLVTYAKVPVMIIK